ncbi:hypothetical protein MMC22_004535 [Lobaria immixta]|nr:hypothetical protein [Lobaria immixta]
MDQISAEYLAEDPFGWHVEFWNDLFVVGIFRGEDAILMALRIEIEIISIPDKDLATKVRGTWSRFRSEIEEQGRQISLSLGPSYRLEENSLTDEYAKQLYRDVDRMLADKKQKTRAYLHDLKTVMSTDPKFTYTELGYILRYKLCDLYQKLCDEEISELHRTEMGNTLRKKFCDLYQTLCDEEISAVHREFQIRDFQCSSCPRYMPGSLRSRSRMLSRGATTKSYQGKAYFN